MELAEPLLTNANRQANFTNELSLDGTIRLLRNEMGLRLLQETLRSWGRIGLTVELPELRGPRRARACPQICRGC